MAPALKESSLASSFLRASAAWANRPALVVNGQEWTFGYLRRLAGRLAATILENQAAPQPLGAVFGYRSTVAYAGILGTLLSGKGYVPLNPNFPATRTCAMLKQSSCNTIIAGEECLEALVAALTEYDSPLTIILPDVTDKGGLQAQFPRHVFKAADEISAVEHTPDVSSISPDAVAYLLFTSGSTGIPKGVPIRNRNITAYLAYTLQRYKVNEDDRFSQTFDLTFDLSVHDMFFCWANGACLYCLPKKSTMAPGKFIKDNQLTVWFSVPSVAVIMSKMRMLSAGSFPSLRYSLFCGEALPASTAAEWQKAAVNSVVENLYGPTEATIAISNYRIDKNESADSFENGIVPIGHIFDGQKKCLVNQQLAPVAAGEPGELCLSGSQVTAGYLDNPEKTETQFIKTEALGDDTWYRTGDLVREDEDGIMHYLGRIDSQIQVLGYRVELLEVDAALRRASGCEMAVSVPWPVSDGIAQGVIGIVGQTERFDESQIRSKCRNLLPQYAVPSRIYSMDGLPLNTNGKVDRNKLVQLLENGQL